MRAHRALRARHGPALDRGRAGNVGFLMGCRNLSLRADFSPGLRSAMPTVPGRPDASRIQSVRDCPGPDVHGRTLRGSKDNRNVSVACRWAAVVPLACSTREGQVREADAFPPFAWGVPPRRDPASARLGRRDARPERRAVKARPRRLLRC